jgi:hypothetical protein
VFQTYRTERGLNSRLGLLRRAAPEEGVQWFEVPPFVGMHTAAAWDEGSRVHVVLCKCAPSCMHPMHVQLKSCIRMFALMYFKMHLLCMRYDACRCPCMDIGALPL